MTPHDSGQGLRQTTWHTLWLVTAVLARWTVAAQAADIATGDGLSLGLDATGAILHCQVGGRDLLRPNARGGFFLADVSAPPGPDRGLLNNGSYEQTDAPPSVGWESGPEWTVDRQIAHTGTASMRVCIPGPDKRSSASLAQEIAVRPNAPYQVTMWVRTEGGTPHLYVEQLDANGRQHPDYPQLTVSHARSRSDWFQLGTQFTTAPFCRRVRVRTNLWQQTGTAWIDDVSLICLEDDCLSPQRLVPGRTTVTAAGLEQQGGLADAGLRLSATYTQRPDHIVVEAEVADTSGRDRAVTVSFRLPVDAVGWTWYDDIHDRQPIEAGQRFGAARLMGGDGRRAVALYPFAALGDARSALALAVPMDQPRAFRLCFEADLGFYVNYEFGLSQDTAKFPGRASFRFFLYRVDPAWGFRSAAERYYAAHPEFFVKRLPREDSIGSLLEPAQYASAGYAFPAYVDFNWHRRQSLPAYRRELCEALHYTEFIGWWGWALGITPELAATKPSPDEALARVRELAAREPPHDVARCILNCIPYGRDGKPQLHANYVPKWGGYNYLCNPDPEIHGLGGGEVNRFSLTNSREVAEMDQFGLAGMRYDNPIVFAMDNFRREHFRWADHPLAFDHVSRKPVLPLDFSSYECGKAIADDLHARGRIVGANYTPVQSPSDLFLIQCLDLIGSETLWTWPTHAKLRLQRTLAWQKTVAMCWQEAKKDWGTERVERELKQALFYGTFYYFGTMGESLYDRWIPLTRRLAGAGWMPVTYAHCAALEDKVERFGSHAQQSLYLTIRNDANAPRTAELVLDAAALGLTSEPLADLWLVGPADAYTRTTTVRTADRWTTELTVPAHDTAVVRVATAHGVALDHLAAVPDALQKAANYRQALLEAGTPGTCPDYGALLPRANAVIEGLRGRHLAAGSARTQLQQLLAGLPETASSAAGKEDDAFLATRLRTHNATARAGLERAAAALGAPPPSSK